MNVSERLAMHDRPKLVSMVLVVIFKFDPRAIRFVLFSRIEASYPFAN